VPRRHAPAILQPVSASAWVNDLQTAIRDYSRTRHKTPVVRITLVTTEFHYVMRVSAAGAGDLLVSLDIYPENVDDLLGVERIDGQPEVERVTPQVLVLPPGAIAKVDILDERHDRPFGFQAE
jgi:hypothetical protein